MQTMKGFATSLPVSQSMLKAVGMVAIQWGYLEFEIDGEIKKLWQHPLNREIAFSFQYPFKRRARAWRKMARNVYDADNLKAVLSISSRAKEIKPDRDSIVHGVYAGGRGHRLRMTHRYAELISLSDTSERAITEVARKISVISAEMLTHTIKVAELLPSSRAKRA